MIAPTNALPTTDRVAAIVAASRATAKVSTGASARLCLKPVARNRRHGR